MTEHAFQSTRPTRHGSNAARKLDFLVIGAAKCGTTTLFELSKDHPAVFIPRDKEVPFFSEETAWRKGLAWYMRTCFGDAPAASRLGTITPHYMLGEGAASPSVVAERIHQALPGVKLIAILRHPVQRAWSHYRMMAQRGHLAGDFARDVDMLLAADAGNRERQVSDHNGFLYGSEYGRILEPYFRMFQRDQLLILYTENLKSDPLAVLREFFGFLEVDIHYRPERPEQEARRGGGMPRVKWLTPGFIYSIPFARKLWKTCSPYSIRKRVEHSVNLWNTKPDGASLPADSPAFRNLVDFYASDVHRLASLSGHRPPWDDWLFRK